MLVPFMNSMAIFAATLGLEPDTQKQLLGQFDVIEVQLKERFSGRSHRHVCETLRLSKDGATLYMQLPCRREFRVSKVQPSFHQGEPVSIVGYLDSKGVHAELSDISPVLAPHRHE